MLIRVTESFVIDTDNIIVIEKVNPSSSSDLSDTVYLELVNLCGSHCVDTIAFYPTPLPYDHCAEEEISLVCGILSNLSSAVFDKMMGLDKAAAEEGQGIEIRASPEMYLRANGMRVSGNTYPESAKNREEWDLLAAAGWYECRNSRLVYNTCFDK